MSDTIEAYAVEVAARLEDGVTPALVKIIDSLERAQKITSAWIGELRSVSMSLGTFARNMEKAAASSAKLGDSPGLTAAAARFDQMAIATADIAKNIETARAAGVSMGGPINGNPGSGGKGSVGATGGGSSVSKSGSQALGVTGIAIAEGIYENAKLQDTLIKSIATEQTPIEKWGPELAALRQRTMEYAQKYAWASGGKIEPFAEAALEGSRLLRTLPEDKQKEMMDLVMPSAALEAKLKNVPMPEAVGAFVGLAHQAGAYTPEKAAPLFDAMVQASLTTHATLGQISNAASYVIPMLTASGGDPADAMMMIATMQQAGIMNTKSGTWLNNMAQNALPNTLGSGLFKNEKQNEALHLLGLYKGNKAEFYENGHISLRKEIGILAEARKHMTPEKFGAATRLAFGVQGARAADMFAEQTVINNLDKLIQLKNQRLDPDMAANALKELNTLSKADQAIANANITIMNASTAFTKPVNWMLDKVSGGAAGAAKFAEDNPATATAGLAAGAFAGIVGAKAIWKVTGGLADKLVIGVTSGLRSLMMFVVRQAAMSLIGFVFDVAAMGAAVTAVTAAIGLGISAILSYAAYQAYQHASRETQDKIGGSVATMMSWFGSKDAQDALDQKSRGDINANALSQAAFNRAKMKASSKPSVNKDKEDDKIDSGQTSKKGQATSGNQQASTQIINLNVDSKKVASFLIPNNMTGTSGFNTSADRPTPGMTSLGMS